MKLKKEEIYRWSDAHNRIKHFATREKAIEYIKNTYKYDFKRVECPHNAFGYCRTNENGDYIVKHYDCDHYYGNIEELRAGYGWGKYERNLYESTNEELIVFLERYWYSDGNRYNYEPYGISREHYITWGK